MQSLQEEACRHRVHPRKIPPTSLVNINLDTEAAAASRAGLFRTGDGACSVKGKYNSK